MKIRNSVIVFLAATTTALLVQSCSNSPYPGYEKSETGLYSKFYRHDENGVKPKEGDVVQVRLIYKTDKDSVLFDSQKMRSGKGYAEFALQKSPFPGSFEEALMTMSVGDSASFKINADSLIQKSFHSKEMPPGVAKGSMLTFEATLLKITDKAVVEKEQKKREEEQAIMMETRKAEEPNALAKYLADNKITTKPTETGLIFIEKAKGKGNNPKDGDKIMVNYTGSFLDGNVFDTSDPVIAKEKGVYDERRPYGPVEFTVGQLVPGMNEGLKMMKPGGKARMILPSSIAYGEGGGPIPPYSTLAFDVEFVGFSDNQSK